MPESRPPEESSPERPLRVPGNVTAAQLGEELHERRASQAAAERALHFGTWIWRPHGGEMEWSDGLYRLLGRDRSHEAPSYDALIGALYTEDKTLFLLRLEQAIKRSEPFTIDHRIGLPSGGVRHVRTEITCLRCATRSERWIGVMADRAAGHHAWEHAHLIIDAVPDLFWVAALDFAGTFFVSRAYHNLWGRDPDELRRNPRDFIDAVVPEDLSHIGNALACRARGCAYEVHYRIRHPNGMVRWIRERGYPLRNDRGAVWAMAGVASDVTDPKQQELELYKGALQAQRLAAECGEAEADARQRNGELLRALDDANQRCTTLLKKQNALGAMVAEMAQALNESFMGIMNDLAEAQSRAHDPNLEQVRRHAEHELARLGELAQKMRAFTDLSD